MWPALPWLRALQAQALRNVHLWTRTHADLRPLIWDQVSCRFLRPVDEPKMFIDIIRPALKEQFNTRVLINCQAETYRTRLCTSVVYMQIYSSGVEEAAERRDLGMRTCGYTVSVCC